MVLELPDLHHLTAAKMTGCMLHHPALLAESQVFECLANQLPINILDIAVGHVSTFLPVCFGNRFDDRMIQRFFVKAAQFSVLERDRPGFITEALGGRSETSVVQMVPISFSQAVHKNIRLCPFVKRVFGAKIVLMSFDPFPMNRNWQAADLRPDIGEQVVVGALGIKGPVFGGGNQSLFTIKTNGDRPRLDVVDGTNCGDNGK